MTESISFFSFLFWVAVFLGIGVAVFLMFNNVPATKNEVIEKWTAFLPSEAGSSKEFFDLVESELDIRGCPYEISRKSVTQGVLDSREFVRVKYNMIYSCYIGFEVIGKDIQFNWSILENINPLYKVPIVGPLLHKFFHSISFIENNKLLAFASFTQNCTQNVVDSIMDNHKIDKKKLSKATSGKLGPL